MKNLIVILLLSCTVLFTACESDKVKSVNSINENFDAKSAVKNIKKLEASLINPENKAMNHKEATEVVKAYRTYINSMPGDDKNPEYMFKLAEVQMGLKRYNKAIDAFKFIYKNYTGYDKRVESLYLAAFINDAYLNQKGNAKAIYDKIIANHPTHKLAKDAQAALQILTMSDEELIKMLEEKNNNSVYAK